MLCLVAPLALATGCAVTGDDTDGELARAMTQAEAARVLDLVNYPGVDRMMLDDVVGLDARAARAIDELRAGADAKFPSRDDHEIVAIAQLDALPYIGDAALQKLSAFAQLHPAPTPQTLEGVRFYGWQAELVLWGVNRVPVGVLDGMLDDRAAENLIAARPFASLTEIGGVALIGPGALERLRSEALVWWIARANTAPTTLAGTYDGVTFDEATAFQALAIANDHTREALVANGVYGNGASAIVGNRPYATLAQVAGVAGVGASTMTGLHAYATALLATPTGTTPDDEACMASSACASGLCTQLTFSEVGTCRPAWMAGTFASTTDAAIPDDDLAGISQTLVVSGLATVAEDLIVNLDLDHPRTADLRIVLTQPSSAESLIWDLDSAGHARVVVGGDLERDSSVNGTWTLTVIDAVAGQSGTLRGWSLELTSRYD